ncbi:lipid kinase YegS [Stappia sp.]|uniref:lipid kinase YegS n=1 Tax=Stappia sp. TaxID=1870903 RepID=UPI0032D97D64
MTASRDLFLILNGKAAARDDVRAAVEAVRAAGHGVEVRVTFDPEDATRFVGELAARASADRPDVVVAGGGDGTVNAVVSQAVAQDCADGLAFAVMPLGTANDFARGQGIPTEDPQAALTLAAEGAARAIDLGRINDRLFVNLASGGTVTHITREADPRAKRVLGGVAYLLAGASRLGELTPSQARFEAEDFRWEGRFLAMAVGNGPMAGGGVTLCPEAVLDDGLLDLTILPYPDMEGVLPSLSEIFNGTGDEARRIAERTRVRTLTIDSAAPLAINLDGEATSATRIEVEVLPGAVSFVLPARG